MADNLVPLRTSLDHRPADPDGNRMSKIAVGGIGLVIMAGPSVLHYAAPTCPVWALPTNLAFWMGREGRH